MKKIIFTLVATFIIVMNVNAQKTLEKGMVTMEIKDMTSSDEQMAMAFEMMKGSQTTIYFDGKQHATQMDMMGGLIAVKTFQNYDTKSFDMLMDMMGQKMWINSNIDEMKKEQALSESEQPVVEYNKEDKKQILGYDCYSVTVKLPQVPDMTLKGYITDAIKTKANIIQGMQDIKFDGFVMEYSLNTSMMNMTMTAVEIKNEIDTSKLTFDSSGYTKMSMEEFKTKMGGFGSGFGF